MVKVKRRAEPKKVVKPKVKKPKIKKLKTRRKVRKAAAKAKVMPQVVGKVTHYFPHVKAGVILVTDSTISLGDTLHIKGHTTDFKQKVTSMQIDNVPIQTAKSGDEVGLKVQACTRHNDVVYKL